VVGVVLVSEEYYRYSTIEACASSAALGFGNCPSNSDYNCYGNSNYFTQAAQCQAKFSSNSCSCVQGNYQTNSDCYENDDVLYCDTIISNSLLHLIIVFSLAIISFTSLMILVNLGVCVKKKYFPGQETDQTVLVRATATNVATPVGEVIVGIPVVDETST